MSSHGKKYEKTRNGQFQKINAFIHVYSYVFHEKVYISTFIKIVSDMTRKCPIAR